MAMSDHHRLECLDRVNQLQNQLTLITLCLELLDRAAVPSGEDAARVGMILEFYHRESVTAIQHLNRVLLGDGGTM